VKAGFPSAGECPGGKVRMGRWEGSILIEAGGEGMGEEEPGKGITLEM